MAHFDIGREVKLHVDLQPGDPVVIKVVHLNGAPEDNRVDGEHYRFVLDGGDPALRKVVPNPGTPSWYPIDMRYRDVEGALPVPVTRGGVVRVIDCHRGPKEKRASS